MYYSILASILAVPMSLVIVDPSNKRLWYGESVESYYLVQSTMYMYVNAMRLSIGLVQGF